MNEVYAHVFCNNKHNKFLVYSTKLDILEYTVYIEDRLNEYSSHINKPVYCNVFLKVDKDDNSSYCRQE